MDNHTVKRITQLADTLSAEEQATLLAFAEFLQQRSVPHRAPPPVLNPIPRPAEESVIAAIKRLSQTYPMLEKSHLLNQTSQLMTQHIMQGKPAAVVIDELEAVFQQHYELFQPTD